VRALWASLDVGIQKYSLQRALNELQESGAIRIDGKTIEILKL
jgi:CRP-like cAMP-binding protein